MHRLLFYNGYKRKKKNNHVKLQIIDNLIYKNYQLIPNDILTEYQNCITQNKITESFEDLINSYYKELKKHLGFYNSLVVNILICIVYIFATAITILLIISSVHSIGSYINPEWSFLNTIPINGINIALTTIMIVYIIFIIIANIIEKQINK